VPDLIATPHRSYAKELAEANLEFFSLNALTIYNNIKKAIENPILLKYMINQIQSTNTKTAVVLPNVDDDPTPKEVVISNQPYAVFYEPKKNPLHYVLICCAPKKCAINCTLSTEDTITITFKYQPMPIPTDCEMHEGISDLTQVITLTLPDDVKVALPTVDKNFVELYGYLLYRFEVRRFERLPTDTTN